MSIKIKKVQIDYIFTNNAGNVHKSASCTCSFYRTPSRQTKHNLLGPNEQHGTPTKSHGEESKRYGIRGILTGRGSHGLTTRSTTERDEAVIGTQRGCPCLMLSQYWCVANLAHGGSAKLFVVAASSRGLGMRLV